MRPIVLCLAGLAAGCAGTPPLGGAGPTYTRASTEASSTAELAAQLLPPEEAAAAESHTFAARIWPNEPLSGIVFHSRPVAVGEDACMRHTQLVNFQTVVLHRNPSQAGDVPVKAGLTSRFAEYALAPGCASLPGRQFAQWETYRQPETEALAILRALAQVQRAAAAPGPLPFRLVCDREISTGDGECATDPRQTLVALPLHQAATVERHPRPDNCSLGSRDIGDAVEIGDRDKGPVWDVRLRQLGTPEAEVALIRQFSRTRVKC